MWRGSRANSEQRAWRGSASSGTHDELPGRVGAGGGRQRAAAQRHLPLALSVVRGVGVARLVAAAPQRRQVG